MTVSSFGYAPEPPARLLVRRSALIMPVNVPAFVDKAHLRGADAIILDLEDGIPYGQAVTHARRVIKVCYEAEAQGRASVGLDGQMIDIPVVARAQRLVERADRIAEFDARKAAALEALA